MNHSMRQMCALVAVLSLGFAAGARATPPDHLVSEVELLCHGGDRVALWVRTVGNAGTYYVTDTAWHLVMIDTASGESVWHEHGGLVRNTVNQLEPGDEVEITYMAGSAPPLGEALAAWGLTDCRRDDRARVWGPAGDERFGVVSREGGVFLTFGEAERELEIAGTWDPSALGLAQFPGGEVPETLPSLEPISALGDSEGQALLRWVPLQTRTLLLVRLSSEFGNRDLVLATPAEATARSAAYLLNARGMEAHRAANVEHSAVWFQEALRRDAGWDVPRYNLACALARQGQADAAVRQLQELLRTAALRTKIAGDRDFDAVREDEGFKAFVDGLPPGS